MKTTCACLLTCAMVALSGADNCLEFEGDCDSLAKPIKKGEMVACVAQRRLSVGSPSAPRRLSVGPCDASTCCEASQQGQYAFGTEDSNKCADGHVPLTSEAACQAAADTLTRSFHVKGPPDSGAPAGCYLETEDWLWWNPHPSGARRRYGDRTLCQAYTCTTATSGTACKDCKTILTANDECETCNDGHYKKDSACKALYQYLEAEPGARCPGGSRAIANEAACQQAAVAVGREYSSDYSTFPACHVVEDGDVFWNQNENVVEAPSALSAAICVVEAADGYKFGVMGENVCPDGYIKMTSAASCKIAAEAMDLRFDSDDCCEGQPAGCLAEPTPGPGMVSRFNSNVGGPGNERRLGEEDIMTVCSREACYTWTAEGFAELRAYLSPSMQAQLDQLAIGDQVTADWAAELIGLPIPWQNGVPYMATVKQAGFVAESDCSVPTEALYQYLEAEPGARCPGGSRAIANEAACQQAAVAVGRSWGYSSDFSTFPACHVVYGEAFWNQNENANGITSEDIAGLGFDIAAICVVEASPICETEYKWTQLGVDRVQEYEPYWTQLGVDRVQAEQLAKGDQVSAYWAVRMLDMFTIEKIAEAKQQGIVEDSPCPQETDLDEEDIQGIMTFLDKDEDGFLSLAEISEEDSPYEDPEDQLLDKMIAEAFKKSDANSDDKLDLDEFTKFDEMWKSSEEIHEHEHCRVSGLVFASGTHGAPEDSEMGEGEMGPGPKRLQALSRDLGVAHFASSQGSMPGN